VFQFGVAQQKLNGTEVSSCFQQMSGTTVATMSPET
jgi:hypothetical protein